MLRNRNIFVYGGGPLRDGASASYASGPLKAGASGIFADTRVVWARGPRGTEDVRYRSLRLYPFGAGAANDEITYRVYGVTPHAGADGNAADRQQAYLGGGVVTLASATGASGAELVTDDHLIADGLTFAAAGAGSKVFDGVEAADPAAYSPADDATQAVLCVPDFGGFAGLAFEFFSDDAAKKATFLVEMLA